MFWRDHSSLGLVLEGSGVVMSRVAAVVLVLLIELAVGPGLDRAFGLFLIKRGIGCF